MPVTHNAAASTFIDGQNTATFNVTVADGNNRAALIGVSWLPIDQTAIDTVTVGGISATFLQLILGSGGGLRVEQYYAVGIPTGVNVVVVDWIGDAPTELVDAVCGIEVMNDVNQGAPIGAIGTAHLTSATALVTLAGIVANSMVVDTLGLVESSGSVTATVDPSQTSRWNTEFNLGSFFYRGAASTKPSVVGSHTMRWVLSASREWLLAAVEFLFQAPSTVSLGGYTSYHYPDDPTPIESLRDPAETQRIWAGDRRFMQELP